MKFSSCLRELRLSRGLSMAQLAKIIGVTDAAISNWENEVNEPKLTYVVALCDFLMLRLMN